MGGGVCGSGLHSTAHFLRGAVRHPVPARTTSSVYTTRCPRRNRVPDGTSQKMGSRMQPRAANAAAHARDPSRIGSNPQLTKPKVLHSKVVSNLSGEGG